MSYKFIAFIVPAAMVFVALSVLANALPPDPQPPEPQETSSLHQNNDLSDDVDDGDGTHHWYFQTDRQERDDVTVSYTANGEHHEKVVQPGDEPVGIFPDSGTAITVSVPEQQGVSCDYTIVKHWKE